MDDLISFVPAHPAKINNRAINKKRPFLFIVHQAFGLPIFSTMKQEKEMIF
jgi:hypothetical protein